MSTCVQWPILEMHPGKDRVIASFEEKEVANMTTKEPEGHIGVTGRQNRYKRLPWWAVSRVTFYFHRSKAWREWGLMTALWAIWQPDHNRWQLAIKGTQRARRTAQTSELSKLGCPSLILTFKPILPALWDFILMHLLFGFFNSRYAGMHQVNILSNISSNKMVFMAYFSR